MSMELLISISVGVMTMAGVYLMLRLRKVEDEF